ncbi:MAG: hypothetical protein Q9160_007305 [Pyrenula sp. 1 TL-2023]
MGSSEGDGPQRNAIREASTLSQSFVADFMSKLSVYEKTLGTRSKGDFCHGARDKVRWATSFSKQVKKVKEDIQFQGLRLNLLLGLENRDLYSQLRKSQKDIEHIHGDVKSSISAEASVLKDALGQSTQKLLDVQTSYVQHKSQVQEALSTQHSAMTLQLANNQSSVTQEILACRDVLSKEMSCVCSAAAGLERLVSALVDDQLQSRIRQKILEHESATVGQVSGTLNTVQDIHSLPPVSLGPQTVTIGQASTRELLGALSQSLATDIAWTYQAVAGKFLCLFKMLICVWPQLVLLSRLLEKIPRSVTLLLEDNINFEDALGSQCSLQFEYFKHWDTFEKMLQHQFRSKPGCTKVADGEYRLFKFKERTCHLDSTNWNDFIRPGMNILMSLKVSNLGKEPGKCPFCDATTNDEDAVLSRCERCDVEFSELSRRRVAGPSQEITAEGSSWLKLSSKSHPMIQILARVFSQKKKKKKEKKTEEEEEEEDEEDEEDEKEQAGEQKEQEREVKKEGVKGEEEE